MMVGDAFVRRSNTLMPVTIIVLEYLFGTYVVLIAVSISAVMLPDFKGKLDEQGM